MSLGSSTFDYVIVGGGSAGCVLASRLTDDPGTSVLLLEAGPRPRSPWIRIPAGLPRVIAPGPYNWTEFTTPQPGLGGRSIWCGHGRTLGGSSAINGMVYSRGHPLDYEGWRQRGNVGWGWDEVLPCFIRSERRAGVSPLRGHAGQLAVSPPAYRHSVIDAFIAAGQTAGLAPNDDFNGTEQDGVGVYDLTIGQGRRCSAYDAFLKPVRARRNLTVLTGAAVDRIVLDEGRAVGVTGSRNGGPFEARAGEVLMSAGAIDSPRLLMLSGIGPGEQLAEHGIAVRADLPGVGANLHDHLLVGVTVDTLPEASLNGRLSGPWQLLHGVRYLLTHSGPVTMGSSQAGAFARCLPGAERPDTQINFRPFSFGRGSKGQTVVERPPRIMGTITNLQPKSRGTIRLASPDPAARPLIDPAYLSESTDEDGLVAAMRLLNRIFRSKPLADQVTSQHLPADADCDDASVRAYIQANAISMSHPVGTCRMGTDDHAVVDPRLRVRGVSGLRVVDASIMPKIPSGNTNAPTIMIGERAAEIIREDRRGARQR